MSTVAREPTSRRRHAVNVLALVVLPAVAALAAVLWAAEDRAAFSADGSIEDVERHITAAGLQLCSTVEDLEGTANQAARSRQYVVAEDCDTDRTAQVTVDEFADVAHRDAAARNHEHQTRPRASGVVYTFAKTLVLVSGSSDDAAQDRLDEILRDAGAR